jgi:glycosyltransferase involved in cell wall biosynthesis
VVTTPERRAVVLVGGPAAPYSRALRIARALTAEGYDTEIAAVAATGLPERERIGRVAIRRYRPSGAWARLGRSAAAGSAGVAGSPGRAGPAATSPPRPARLRPIALPALAVRRWLLWPHAVRGWWTTLARELEPADLYHACGVLALPAALAARERAARSVTARPPVVVYDAIDDPLDGNEARRTPPPIRWWHRRRETGWARRADARTTVNDALADRLARRWGTSLPTVLLNAPEPPGDALLEAPPDLLREATGLPAATRIILFQGRLGPDLGLEAAAEAVLRVPDAALVLLGFGRGYAAAAARDADPRYRGRHLTLPARPPDELLAWTASADVAIVPLPPVSANQRLSSPNKFWEALAVGTPVVVPRQLEVMSRLVDELDLGTVAASPAVEDLAAAIRMVLGRDPVDRRAWRRRIATTAAERFGWPAQAAAYRALVRSVSDRPRPSP